MAIEKTEDTTALLTREPNAFPVLEESNIASQPALTPLTHETDEIAQWIAAGERATAAAHAFLRAHGASIIYGCGDYVCEELPNGTVIKHPPGETPSTLRNNTKQEADAS